jgi:hypothetical protein
VLTHTCPGAPPAAAVPLGTWARIAGPAGGGDAVGAGADRDGAVVDAEAGAGAEAGGAAVPAEADEPPAEAMPDLFTPPWWLHAPLRVVVEVVPSLQSTEAEPDEAGAAGAAAGAALVAAAPDPVADPVAVADLFTPP